MIKVYKLSLLYKTKDKTLALMTATLNRIAKQITDYVAFNCDGTSEGFEVDQNGFTAFVNYRAEYREVRGGDSYCGMWETVPELVSEETTVEAVCDAEGNELPEMAEALQILLN